MTASASRVRDAVIDLHNAGIKPTPRNVYEKLTLVPAQRGLTGMRILNGTQGRARTQAMRDLGWRLHKSGYWQPPRDWVRQRDRNLPRVAMRWRVDELLRYDDD